MFECAVDFMAMQNEVAYGIDLNRFWIAWRKNPVAFWGAMVSQGAFAVCISLTAMSTAPTKIFCASPDPCSCQGGGFDLYTPLCRVRDGKLDDEGNSSKAMTFNSTLTNVTYLEKEYVSLWLFFGEDTAPLVVSAALLVSS